jgi:NADPH-dependent curcumin reductase CurA
LHPGPRGCRPPRTSAFLLTVGIAIADGRIRYREDITDGLENAPAAFIGMLEGRNFGKALVRVAP